MGNNKISICIVVLCVFTLLSVPVYATSNNNNKTTAEQKDVLDTLTNNNAEKIVPNNAGQEQVQEILNEKEVDTNFMEKVSNEGDVKVEKINNQDIAITIDVDKPVRTLLYDNGIQVEEREKIGLVIENESKLSTNKYVDNLEKIVDNTTRKKQHKIKTSFFKFNLIEPAYAYDENTHQVITTGPTSKIKLKKRIIYNFASQGGQVPLRSWYRILRSSSYIMSSTYKVKSIKMKSTYQGFNSPKIYDFQRYFKYRTGSATGSKISSPSKGKYYILSSPTSNWFNAWYGFKYNTTTVLEYVKSGKTNTSTYSITLSRQ